MGFTKARDSNLHDEEKGEGLPILPIHPAAFRETAHRRWRRQASTLARAVHAGRVRASRIRGVTLLRSTARVFAASLRLLPRRRASSGCR
jgi:hypothetical protein